MAISDSQQLAGQNDVGKGRTCDPTIVNLLNVLLALPAILRGSAASQKKKLPPPPVTWALIALMRFRGLCSLATRIRSEIVGSIPDFVDLPGTEWQYCGDEKFVYLRNLVTGETVSPLGYLWADKIEIDAFLSNCASTMEAPSVSKRAFEFFPAIDAMRVALRYLEECQFLKVIAEGDDEFVALISPLIRFQDGFDHFSERWSRADEEGRVNLAKAIDDCFYIDAVAPTAESHRQVNECRDEWVAYLHDKTPNELSDAAFLAMAHMGELKPELDS